MRMVWLTDTHLNILDDVKRQVFYKTVQDQQVDAIIHSGDIAEAQMTFTVLNEMQASCQCPIYFVYGNHDYYGVEISETKQRLHLLQGSHLYWLPDHTYIKLSESIALLGQDGWADLGYGDYLNSDYEDRDLKHIPELIRLADDKVALKDFLQALARQEAQHCEQQLLRAVEDGFTQIWIVTHVPPFAEASWHWREDRQNNASRLPFFANKSLGDCLLAFAKAHPHRQFTVFCGHTHTARQCKIIDNLAIKVGGATTGEPHIIEVLAEIV